MKILIDGEKNFYKVNLHTHTTLSDGKFTPEQVKEMYKSRGYAAVAYTDHEILYDHSALTDENFVALNGYEIATNNDRSRDPLLKKQSAHFNYLAKRPDILTQIGYNRDYDWCHTNVQKDEAEKRSVHLNYERFHNLADFNRFTAWANESGFLVTYNHPAWSLHTAKDYSGLRGLFAVETYNAGSVYGGYEETRAPYDDLLAELWREHEVRLNAGEKSSRPAPLYTVFADDMHEGMFEEAGYVMVQAESLSYENLISALEKGEFYSSMRPCFYDLRVKDGVLCGKTSRVRRVSVIGAARDKLCINGAIEKFEIPLGGGFERYFRVEITDENGYIATTNAFFGALK